MLSKYQYWKYHNRCSRCGTKMVQAELENDYSTCSKCREYSKIRYLKNSDKLKENQREKYKKVREIKRMMNSTGLVRNIDELGRLVIPKEYRKVLGINENAPVELYFDKETGIIGIKKFEKCCSFCGKIGVMEVEENMFLCEEHIKKIKVK